MLQNSEHHVKISDFLVENSIKWTFIPPHSSHIGGLWETAIKSTKTHLRKIIGSRQLSYEELYKLLIRIEACLNSRPICPMSDDGTNLTALTPGHFIIGVPLTSLPKRDISDIQINRVTRYQLLMRMRQDFWRRWSNEYLNSNNVTSGLMLRIPALKWALWYYFEKITYLLCNSVWEEYLPYTPNEMD